MMKTGLENIPEGDPYLRAEPADLAAWRGCLGDAGGDGRIGLVWAGSPTHRNDRNRSISPALLGLLLDTPGADFYSLQVGPAGAALAELDPAGRVADLAPHIGDFADTAAAVECLDLIITVDTAVAHLAGGLGKPVWVLLPFSPDWRWMLDRDDSPWYSSMRLFRQQRSGDWAAVVKRLREALTDFLTASGNINGR